MTKTFAAWFTSLALIALALEFLAVARWAVPAQVDSAGAAAAIALITAAAVGIERTIEMFWTAVGLLKDSWWPFGKFREQLDTLVGELNGEVGKYLDKARVAAEQVEAEAKPNQAGLKPIAAEIERVRARTNTLGKSLNALASDRQQVQLQAASAVDAVSYVERLLPGVQRDAASTMQAITGVTDFVETFKDNPGRRLISIFAGAWIGLLVAWAFGLDVFRAALASEVVATSQAPLFPALGVAMTGVLLGLGANPTHEVIRLIQEYKKSQKTANNPTPVPGGEARNVVEIALVARDGDNAPVLQGLNGLPASDRTTRFTAQERQG